MEQENLVRSFGTLERAADAARSVNIIASTEAVDDHGTIIDQASWKLERFIGNPVVLLEHGVAALFGGDPADRLPIAHAENVRVTGGKLRARVVFPAAGRDALADKVWTAVEDGRLRGVSVGFRPGRAVREEANGRDVLRLLDCSLHELSLCAIPSNSEALVQRSVASLDAYVRELRVESRRFDQRVSEYRRKRYAELGEQVSDLDAIDAVLRNADLADNDVAEKTPAMRAREEFDCRVASLRAREPALLASEAIDRVLRGLDGEHAA